MIESNGKLTKEEIKAELQAAGIDTTPAAAKLRAMIEAKRQELCGAGPDLPPQRDTMKTLRSVLSGDPGRCEFDDDRDLCEEFVSCFAVKEPYVWQVPGTNLWLYQHKSPPQRGNWSIGETLEDGDERTYCYIRSCGELRTMLPLVLAALEHNDVAYRQSLKPGHRVIVENLKGVRPSLARLVSSGHRHIVVRLDEKPHEELTCLHCEVEILPENTRL